MKKTRALLACFALLLPVCALRAQEKTSGVRGGVPGGVPGGVGSQEKADKRPEKVTPLRVQVVFTEYEGEKKVSSAPYSLLVNASDLAFGDQKRLRMGIRVPIQVQSKEGAPQVQYMDVGTNVDCRAFAKEGGRYDLELGVEKTSVYTPSVDGKPSTWTGIGPVSSQPLLTQFRGNFSLSMVDGQTIQTTSATDPVSGRVLKVDVTLTVVK